MGYSSGLNLGLGALPLMTSARTRSISAENPTGEKGKGGMADDIASVAYWYQAEPHAEFPRLPSLEERYPR